MGILAIRVRDVYELRTDLKDVARDETRSIGDPHHNASENDALVLGDRVVGVPGREHDGGCVGADGEEEACTMGGATD